MAQGTVEPFARSVSDHSADFADARRATLGLIASVVGTSTSTRLHLALQFGRGRVRRRTLLDVASSLHAADSRLLTSWLTRRVADTHAILFTREGADSAESGGVFERCERQQAIIYVPAIVMWEVSLRACARESPAHRRGFFDDLFSNPSYQPFDMAASRSIRRLRQRDPIADLRGGACLDLPL